ncbi:hypothetical protein [Bacillus benzoevorans]|uniref:Uncharacterized protein n=1 Tax=Bacillus benzoevorans TaxID=1456 RepID=A0A7X0HR88_9BACI|nr:hypothetical protein [Bacillus benzoevorans]MBB6444155.1 hypothetical protein [Bacillus benzoevorans]
MADMDGKMISIFKESTTSSELHEAMRDIVKLAGVLKEMSDEDYFQSPVKLLKVLRLLNILQEEALGLSEQEMENEKSIYYRYRNLYGEDEDMSLDDVKHLVYVLGKYNWIMKTPSSIKMRSLGKRLLDLLIRLANDSLAYYLHDDITRSLFQAKRDAELSEAYDDKGISGGNKLASMIRNVEEAVKLLKERELEYLANRHALTQVQLINTLMEELEVKMNERIRAFETFEDSLPLTNLFQQGIYTISEGIKISLGTINKIVKFTNLQQTEQTHTIRPELIRNYMIKTFHNPYDEDPDPHQILSFMEQDQYEDEAMDGMWIPVKFAAPLTAEDILDGIDYIENYEPATNEIEEILFIEYGEPEELSDEEIAGKMEESQWKMTKEQIPTEHIERYLEESGGQAQLHSLVFEVGEGKWGDALQSLLGVAAMVSNQRAELGEEIKSNTKITTDTDWEWMEGDLHGRKTVRARKPKR